MEHPARLPWYKAVSIAIAVWEQLYLERNASGGAILNPDKPCSGADLVEKLGELLGKYDLTPTDWTPICECLTPGQRCCGVPGVLAHLEDRKTNSAHVRRCKRCCRFASDEAAVEELEHLDLLVEE